MNAESAAGQKLLLRVGSLGPLGHMPASGTVTVAVVGLPAFYLLSGLPVWILASFAVVFFFLSVWIHERGDRILGEKDSRKLVWDELAGFWVAILAVPFTWQIACVAFLVERAIDIAKIPPANTIENRWPGGWGVVGDDIVAGAYTCAILHLLMQLAPGLMGIAATA
ncbi:MAG: phosphatidylglycerophosphatase A family protein [Planctomycetota bacterium]